MNQIQPHSFNPNQATDAMSSMAAGATIFVLLVAVLYVAIAIYFLVMPLLIYLRLGRIARAVESTDLAHKGALIELKQFVALQQKLESNATVQTTILKNLDQNLAMAINRVLPGK
jgi:hypothetical protein